MFQKYGSHQLLVLKKKPESNSSGDKWGCGDSWGCGLLFLQGFNYAPLCRENCSKTCTKGQSAEFLQHSSVWPRNVKNYLPRVQTITAVCPQFSLMEWNLLLGLHLASYNQRNRRFIKGHHLCKSFEKRLLVGGWEKKELDNLKNKGFWAFFTWAFFFSDTILFRRR